MTNIIPFPLILGGSERHLPKSAEAVSPANHFMAETLIGIRDLLANITADLEVRLAELNEAVGETP